MLETNDRGGIRIQYSKSPLNRKRDAGGNLTSGGDGGAAPTYHSLPVIQL